MFNMIKSDLYRIIKSKSIYVMVILMIITDTLLVILKSAFSISISSGVPGNNDFPLPLCREVLSCNNSIYYFSIFIVFSVLVNDLSCKTAANSISTVCSRTKYFLSKNILIYSLVTVLFIFHCSFFYVLNLPVNGSDYYMELGDYAKIVLLQYPVILGLTGFMLTIGFVLKNSHVFVTTAIITPMSLTLFFTMVIAVTSYAHMTGLANFISEHIAPFLMEIVLYQLAFDADNLYIFQSVIIYLLFATALPCAAYFRFRKSEI